MKDKIKRIIRKLSGTRLGVVFFTAYQMAIFCEYSFLRVKWVLSGKKKPSPDAVELMKENVTFIFKSFERQGMAKRLYKNIQSYYPGVKVIIADDSTKPLRLQSDSLEVIQLPFNSGLSFGINRALENVKTPFVIRMDDDELLTPHTCFHKQLEFLMAHPEVDLVGLLPFNLPGWTNLQEAASGYYKQSMSNAPKKLKIPHLTQLDETHKVVAKAPNIFIARTDKIREVGYDDNIRMIDHNEFFYRAAGNIVSVLDSTCYVMHYHNQFDNRYQSYRSDIGGDLRYIKNKHGKREKADINSKFLEALGASLKKETVAWTEMSSAEWHELFHLAFNQQVLPLVYEAVCRCPAASKEQELMLAYKKNVFSEVAQQVVTTNEFLKLYQKLCDAGAKPLVIKGLVCREHYLLPNHRLSMDEDILIPQEQFEIVHQVMLDAGMQLKEPEQDICASYEVPYVKDGTYLYIEIHKQLFPEDAEAYGDYNHFFEGVHERAIQEIIQGTQVYTMGYTDHLIYLICHAFKHFLHSGVGVRQVCDIVLFANAHGAQIDWDRVLECCEEMRAEKIMATVFRIGQKYFGFDMEKACYPQNWQAIKTDENVLLKDMLEGGVLGNVGMERLHSSNITLNAVSAQKKGEKVKGTLLKTIFPPAKKMIGQYKYLEKYPYLLPAAWLTRIVKYGKEIKKSQDNDPSKSIEIGNKRIEMMKEYGVIKKDEK